MLQAIKITVPVFAVPCGNDTRSLGRGEGTDMNPAVTYYWEGGRWQGTQVECEG